MRKKIAMVLAMVGVCAAAYAVTDQQREDIRERIKPVGEVCEQGDDDCGMQLAQADSGESKSPEEIYNQSCKACHATGVGGAPEMGDTEVWSQRLDEKGREELYSSAINGLNAMPPKGTCMDCSEDDLKATVDYMIEESQ